MTISLEKKLEEATVAKRRYRALFVVAFVLLAVLAGSVYHATVLDYAVIDRVTMTRTGENRQVAFAFDVIEPGRLDFHYGPAVLTDRKVMGTGEGFRWQWTATSPTEIAIRSRQWFWPRWHQETFTF